MIINQKSTVQPWKIYTIVNNQRKSSKKFKKVEKTAKTAIKDIFSNKIQENEQKSTIINRKAQFLIKF